METISCTTVVVDDTGQIVALDGVDGSLGINPDIAGRPWMDAFESWGLPPLANGSAVTDARQMYACSPTGEALNVEFIPIPSRNGSRQTIVLFRSAFGSSISDRQEQLCGLGEIAAGVAHEMNNALTLLIGWLELLMVDYQSDMKLFPTLDLLMGEANRIGQLTRNLLEVARGNAESSRPLDLGGILDEVLTLVRYEMQNSNIELERIVPDNLPTIQGSSGRLKQAMLNLLLNARQAMPTGGKVTVSAAPDPNGFVNLAVSDTGCGMSEDTSSRIFSPFFTTKENGTGLGLSVTRKIIEDHGGVMELESALGKGTRFTLKLPAATE
jgi:signal transduction histidine kinase